MQECLRRLKEELGLAWPMLSLAEPPFSDVSKRGCTRYKRESQHTVMPTYAESSWGRSCTQIVVLNNYSCTCTMQRMEGLILVQIPPPLLGKVSTSWLYLLPLKTFLNTQDKWETIKLNLYSTFHGKWTFKYFTMLNHTVTVLNNVNLFFFSFNVLLLVLLLLSHLNNSFPSLIVQLYNSADQRSQ